MLQLIRSKIRVPRPSSTLLQRQRLLDFLHTHIDRKLILLTAPAGYGKTSLLVEFAQQTDLPVCWCTLDAFDRDLSIFLEHLIGAIALRFPAFGEQSRAVLRQTPNLGRNLYPIVSALVQEIYDSIPEYFCLILDDHHAVQDQEQINEFLSLLLQYVDENCHLVLASRGLPALPSLPTLTARQQVVGLGFNDLRFTADEIQCLARESYDLDLTSESASEWAERTQGWITGIVLSAIPQWQGTGTVVTGQIDIGVYEYLSRQVLDDQPDDLRRFMLDSSVLDELDAELCTAVVETGNPQELMDQLKSYNLFVTGYQGDEGQLRYHDLFRDFLRATLKEKDRARYRSLVYRAADAYAGRRDWDRAIDRYLQLEDIQRTAQLLDDIVIELFQTGRWESVSSWLDALPSEVLDAHPRLLLYRGRILADQGTYRSALSYYDRAELAFGAANPAWSAYTAAMTGSLLRNLGRYSESVENCERALAAARGDSLRECRTRALSHQNIGLCQLRQGHLPESTASLLRALRLYGEIGDIHDQAMTHSDLAFSYELAGELAQAASHYRAALQSWEKLGNASSWANTLNGLGVLLHLQGKYDKANEVLNQALAKARLAGNSRITALAQASLGDIHRDLGAYDLAQEAYLDALGTIRTVGGGFVATYTLDALGNLERLRGNLGRAAEWLQEAMDQALEHDSAYEQGLCHISQGIVASETGNLAFARKHLDRAAEILDTGGFRRDLARALLHRAQVLYLADEPDAALSDLEEALFLASKLGTEQFITVEGARMVRLLALATRSGVAPDILPAILVLIKAHQERVASRPETQPEVQSSPSLTLRALGLPTAELDGERVKWLAIGSRNLLFCLLQHPRGLDKDRLSDLLWPDLAPAKLDSQLHSTLYRLRRAIGSEYVVYEDGRYRFDREGDFWLDVDAFEALLVQAGSEADKPKAISQLQEALALFRGDYLEGLYDDWCTVERERLAERRQAAQLALARLFSTSGSYAQAIDLFQQVLARDPYQEVAHRGLMDSYHHSGERTAAIRQYQDCAAILRDELGLHPMPETKELYRKIIE